MSFIEAGTKNKERFSSGNPLAKAVDERIRQNGPIPFREYTRTWLYGSGSIPGYYTGDAPVVGNNDNTTSNYEVDFETPSEISPLFGYSLAGKLLDFWREMGKPHNFNIVEMGAGNGTLAKDILQGIRDRVVKKEAEPEASNIKYTIVDAGSGLMSRQKDRLKDFSDQVGFVNASAGNLPLSNIEGVFLSVELPDAFPIDVVRRARDGSTFEQLFIDKGDNERFKELWQPLGKEVEEYMERHEVEIEEGSFYPVNLDAEKWMEDMSRALKRGYILTVDYFIDPSVISRMYGSREKVNTLGIDLKPSSVFDKRNIGEVDITQGVDFQMLSDTGKKNGLETLGYSNLEGFLWSIGFDLLMDKSGDLNLGRPIDLRKTSSLVKPEVVNIWDVILQSKGVDVRNSHEFKYFYNPDRQRQMWDPRFISF